MRLSPLPAGLATLVLVTSIASAQSQIPFPLELASVDPDTTEVIAVPRSDRIQAITGYRSVVLTGVTLPGGQVVSLDLTRIDVERLGFRYVVDGEHRSDLLSNLDLSVWTGMVSGAPASHVSISFSHYGSHGWIDTGDEVFHVISRPNAEGSWVDGTTLLTTNALLASRGVTNEFECLTEPPASSGVALPQATAEVGPPSVLELGSGCALYEARVSIETDFQMFENFNDLPAITAYLTSLLAEISNRFETQASTILTFPYVAFYTNASDPWSSPESGDCADLLGEFEAAWMAGIPGASDIGLFLSGADLNCGVTATAPACSEGPRLSVATTLDGQVTFPVVPSVQNWDFHNTAHELGHDFGCIHTHDYCPPIDECAPTVYFGPCQTQQACTNTGTLMSFCYLCTGGEANITTFFHPVSATVIQDFAESCLPFFEGWIGGDAPSFVSETGPTPVSAQVNGTPVGDVQLLYRFDDGPFVPVVMADAGGGVFTAALPTASCADGAEFYYAYMDSTCGPITDPVDAPASTYTAVTGTSTVLFDDNFETDQGWTTEAVNATSGQWERGVPVNDPAWEWDPAVDADGSGNAFLTQNALGNTDVDGGSVRLTSPTLNMAGGLVEVRYAYYLHLSVADGVDRLIVEANPTDGVGDWTTVAVHDTDSAFWREHTIDMASTGVPLTTTMRLRFEVNDESTPSIVEAGVDAFSVSRVQCSGNPPDGNYCTSTPNSTGSPAAMSATGTTSVAVNDLVLVASNVPGGQFGIFYYGPDEIAAPFGNGTRCVGGPEVFRLDVEVADGTNTLSHSLDNTIPPTANGQIAPGETVKFQAWFRDPAGGGAFFDLSDGYSVTFQP